MTDAPNGHGAVFDGIAADPHPLVDETREALVVTRSAARLVHASQGRLGFLADAVRARRQPVLVTSPASRLTFAMAATLFAVGGRWALDPADSGDEPAADLTTSQWTQIVASVHHAARDETILGGTLELLAERLGAGAPVGWGVAEPAGLTWDRSRLTRYVRERMPQETRLMVDLNGTLPMAATHRTFRSATGVVEETKLAVAGVSSRRAGALATDALRDLMGAQQVLFGFAFSHEGPNRPEFTPSTAIAPRPLAAALGARTVRDLRVDIERVRRRPHVEILGTARLPSVVVSFPDRASTSWALLGRTAAAAGPRAVARLLGMDGLDLDGTEQPRAS
jgi:hypothetical protein